MRSKRELREDPCAGVRQTAHLGETMGAMRKPDEGRLPDRRTALQGAWCVVYADSSQAQQAFYRHELDPRLVHLVAAVRTGEAALAAVVEDVDQVDAVVLDADVPLGVGELSRATGTTAVPGGLATARLLRQRVPQVLLLLVTNDEDHAVTGAVRELGPRSGYARKDSIADSHDLAALLSRLHAGETVFDAITRGPPRVRSSESPRSCLRR